jgi:hypothetical protein
MEKRIWTRLAAQATTFKTRYQGILQNEKEGGRWGWRGQAIEQNLEQAYGFTIGVFFFIPLKPTVE